MTDDASLTDFLDESGEPPDDDESGATDGSATTDAAGGDVASDAGPTPEETDAAESTYRVLAEPEPCVGCEESVRRLWRDGDRFVCRACKDWTSG